MSSFPSSIIITVLLEKHYHLQDPFTPHVVYGNANMAGLTISSDLPPYRLPLLREFLLSRSIPKWDSISFRAETSEDVNTQFSPTSSLHMDRSHYYSVERPLRRRLFLARRRVELASIRGVAFLVLCGW